jgi:predicted nucleic acid-binding protein
MTVCIDASIAVKLITGEPDSDQVHAWFEARVQDRLVAPAFMPYEVASALRRKVLLNSLTEEQAVGAIKLLAQMDIQLCWDWALAERALVLAFELGQPTAYDTAYLALAEQERCSVITADKAFARACSDRFPFVQEL